MKARVKATGEIVHVRPYSDNRPSVLVCDGMIEGGCELFLGYFDGEAWYMEDGLRVFPTHYMKIVLPNED